MRRERYLDAPLARAAAKSNYLPAVTKLL
jgi:hypothetical protein